MVAPGRGGWRDGRLMDLNWEIALTWNDGKIEDVLLGVVRHALWRTPLPSGELTARRFGMLMDVAVKQTVAGLVGAALMEEGSGVVLPSKAVLRMIMQERGIRSSNARVASSLQSLCAMLGSSAIPFVVVKGQVVGSLYPRPELRMPGDIDFYVSPADWDKALKLVRLNWNPTFHADTDGEQHVAFEHEGTLFEMHYNLHKFYDRRNQAFFDGIVAHNISHASAVRVPGADCDVPTLCHADNVLYTFLHLYHHLVELGCGLRQFCDLAMLLSHLELGAAEVGRLRRNLETLGFMGAFRAVGAVLVLFLGMPAEKFPFELAAADGRYGGELLSIVFRGGNFGFHDISGPMRVGWRYYVKAFCRKAGRYRAFYHLAPRETRAMLMRELPRKVALALTGKI